MTCRDDRTVTGCCTLPLEPVSAWVPASLGNVLLLMVVNVVGSFVADSHHQGVLWRLPERVVDSIPLLGLYYLLEGSPYKLDTVKQLLQTQKEYDWLNWGHNGFHEVRGAPVQLVGSQYLVQDLPPVTVANPPGVDDF
jgi:hypothetical protein